MHVLDSQPKLLPSSLRLEELPVLEPAIAAVEENRLVGFNSGDPRARPFNLLRTTFSKKLKEGGHRLIGLTSAAPAAGKTFISMNLASSLAQVAEEQVFLVDLDLRRASLAKDLGYEPPAGIESVLSGKVTDLREIGVRIEGTDLGLFPARRLSSKTGEILSSGNFRDLVEYFRKFSGSSIILFDLPPVFANDDAMISLEHLDGYLLIVDTGKTTRRQLQDMIGMLRPTPNIGFILNRYQGGFTDPYGYGYGYGYGKSAYSRYYE